MNQRPQIESYIDPIQFLQDMLLYRKSSESDFSVLKATRTLRRVSPTLISLLIKRKRRLTFDRVDEIAKLLALRPSERTYFKQVLIQPESPTATENHRGSNPANGRKEVSSQLLSDWVNPYVKDCFQIEAIQTEPRLLYKFLAHIASPKRIDHSLKFLMREGHLRKMMDGRIVPETQLTITNTPIPSKKVKQFHKGALKIAREGLDVYGPAERFANTLLMPLNPKNHSHLLEMISDFSHQLQSFAENTVEDGERLYQVILNVSPTGGGNI